MFFEISRITNVTGTFIAKEHETIQEGSTFRETRKIQRLYT